MQATQPDLILQFGEQCFHLLFLSLGVSNSGVLANSRTPLRAGSCWWKFRDQKGALVHSAFGAHVPQRLGFSNVVEGAIPINSTPIVKGLACGTDIAIVFRFVNEAIGTEVGTPLSEDTVAGRI